CVGVAKLSPHKPQKKELVGVDVFVDWRVESGSVESLINRVNGVSGDGLSLKLVANRGLKIWPGELPNINYSDHWRFGFLIEKAGTVATHKQVANLLMRFADAGIDFIKTEHLYTFDGKPGYTLAAGE
ncbi:MAG: NADP-dependent isocitrate dehydrogenase, partial [Alphaproteobacteria bacterium]|nr:NADP-dependent isocitrate dehydrogenase [Alphaproteobacteria bacterium]